MATGDTLGVLGNRVQRSEKYVIVQLHPSAFHASGGVDRADTVRGLALTVQARAELRCSDWLVSRMYNFH